jgi:predicted nucleotidyltransferase
VELEEIAAILQDEARALSREAPGADWYLFGSIIRRDPLPSDVDLLIVYEKDADARVLRRGLAHRSRFFPLHLLLLRKDEENELHFVNEQKALCIFLHRREKLEGRIKA